MRLFETGVLGSALAYLTWSFSQAGTGGAHAAAFLLAILIVVITTGIAVSMGTHAWPEDAGMVITGPRWLHQCHGCGHRMIQQRSAWICRSCDRAPHHV